MPWAEDWDARMAGTVCRFCREGRPDETSDGVRIYRGQVSDAYLPRRVVMPGYAVVIWRGRHVVEPTELTASEAAKYGRDVLLVGRAIQRHFRALKMNYATMGNWNPHLHTHVTARYTDDRAPGEPLPPLPLVTQPEAQWRSDCETLRDLLADPTGLLPGF